ncbi:MAG: histidinol-phosphatase HisJ family protein [Eubacterium sp.]|nr:histidinol-phosphatase HisJ family protein [Eubacterium sp.]
MILYDMHLHSDFSSDSSTPAASQVDSARQAGLHGICLTDHMDYDFPKEEIDFPLSPGEIPFEFSLADYFPQLKKIREENPDLTILTGIECGLQTTPSVLEKNSVLTDMDEFDFIIGSLHLVNKKDPYYPSFWDNRDPEEAIRQYLDQLYKNITAFHHFDTLGHLDYIVRYAPVSFSYEPSAFQEQIDAILSFLIRHDIALEFNTSGYKKTPHGNPHEDILRRYKDLGGVAITIGSDAHSPEYVGYRFRQAESLLVSCGFKEYYTFQKHTPVSHQLGQ